MNNYTLLRQAIGQGWKIHLDIQSKRAYRETLDTTTVDDSRRIILEQIRRWVVQKIIASHKEVSLAIIDINIPWIFQYFYYTGWNRWIKLPRTAWLECFVEWNTELNGMLVNTLIDNTIDRIWRIAKNIVDLRNPESDLRKKTLGRIYNFIRVKWYKLGHPEILEIAENIYLSITYGGIDADNWALKEEYSGQQLMSIFQFTTMALKEFQNSFFQERRDRDAMTHAIRSSTGYIMDRQIYQEWQNGYRLSQQWYMDIWTPTEDEIWEKSRSDYERIQLHLSNPELPKAEYISIYEAILSHIWSLVGISFSINNHANISEQIDNFFIDLSSRLESLSRYLVDIVVENYDRYLQYKNETL